MNEQLLGILSVLAMFVLMFAGVPVAVAMILPALIGILLISGPQVLAATVDSTIWNHAMSFPLATIPLFVLMGELLSESGITHRLFDTVRIWFGRLRGSLALSTIGASTVMAAASGSSVATTGTMGVVAGREMHAAKYDPQLASGAIVSGGGLGILIPPSTLLLLYGTLTEESIGQLLIAGVVPGLILTGLLMLTVIIFVIIKPSVAPGGEPHPLIDKFKSLGPISLILVIFLVVMGSMYSGWASPTESAALGVVGALAVGLGRRSLSVRGIMTSLVKTIKTTGFIFAIVLGSFILNHLLAVSQIAGNLTRFIAGLETNTFMIFLAIVLMYLVLGAFMDSFAMVVITVPLVMPIVDALALDPIWFGIVLVVLVEIALITPPVGMNLFVLRGVSPELSMGSIMKGALVFVIPMLAMVFLLYFIPDIALWLPSNM